MSPSPQTTAPRLFALHGVCSVSDAQLSDAIQVRNDVRLARFGPGVIAFGDPNDRFDHIWKAAATAPPLLQAVVDLCGHNELPGILFEHLEDCLFDLLFSDDVAVTDQHAGLGLGLEGRDISHSRWLRRRFDLLEHLVGRIQAVGAFERNGIEVQHVDRALDRLGLVDQRIDPRLHCGVAIGIGPTAPSKVNGKFGRKGIDIKSLELF